MIGFFHIIYHILQSISTILLSSSIVLYTCITVIHDNKMDRQVLTELRKKSKCNLCVIFPVVNIIIIMFWIHFQMSLAELIRSKTTTKTRKVVLIFQIKYIIMTLVAFFSFTRVWLLYVLWRHADFYCLFVVLNKKK